MRRQKIKSKTISKNYIYLDNDNFLQDFARNLLTVYIEERKKKATANSPRHTPNNSKLWKKFKLSNLN